MIRHLAALAVVLAALVAWDRALERAADERRAERGRVGRILPAERHAELQVAAVQVEAAGGRSHLYGRAGGLWRCLDHRSAPADAEAIAELVEALTEAEGLVVTDEVGAAAQYGIGTPETIRVLLCGPRVLDEPGRDVLEAFDVGKSVPGRGGSFLRRRGSPEVWAVDRDPRPLLAPGPGGRPPLLARGVVPGAWPGWRSGLARVAVERADGTGYALERRLVEVTPEDLQRGAPPWAWTLEVAGESLATAPLPTTGYTLFLARAPYEEVLDPARKAELGLELPAATVTLVPREGEPLRLLVGPAPADPGGSVAVWNDWTQALLRVRFDVAELLAPVAALLRAGQEANPWDPWVR